MNSWLILIVAILKSYISPANARPKKEYAKLAQNKPIKKGKCSCPDTIPEVGEKCKNTGRDRCTCTYDATEILPECHLSCNLEGFWAMTCSPRTILADTNDPTTAISYNGVNDSNDTETINNNGANDSTEMIRLDDTTDHTANDITVNDSTVNDSIDTVTASNDEADSVRVSNNNKNDSVDTTTISNDDGDYETTTISNDDDATARVKSNGPNDPNFSNEDADICDCPNKNPIFMNRNTCDSAVWDICKRSCTYSNPACSYTCDGDYWVEECIEQFDSHSNISCVDGKCSLSDECLIPRAGGYWISGPHLSGMSGEYRLIPEGCTGSCTGCVLSSSTRTSSVLASYVLHFSLGISIITALMY